MKSIHWFDFSRDIESNMSQKSKDWSTKCVREAIKINHPKVRTISKWGEGVKPDRTSVWTLLFEIFTYSKMRLNQYIPSEIWKKMKKKLNKVVDFFNHTTWLGAGPQSINCIILNNIIRLSYYNVKTWLVYYVNWSSCLIYVRHGKGKIVMECNKG